MVPGGLSLQVVPPLLLVQVTLQHQGPQVNPSYQVLLWGQWALENLLVLVVHHLLTNLAVLEDLEARSHPSFLDILFVPRHHPLPFALGSQGYREALLDLVGQAYH